MPQYAAAAGLPAQGMLWFFADIDEEMIWPSEPGHAQSRVMYWPDSTVGTRPCDPPETLPEVDHPAHQRETPPSYRGPRPRVYPRWSLTGHLADVWDIDDVPHEPGAYEAVAHANDKARDQIVGTPPDRPSNAMSPFVEVEEQLEGGGIKRTYEYQPDRAGPQFPQTGHFAKKIADAFGATVQAQLALGGPPPGRDDASRADAAAKFQALQDAQRAASELADAVREADDLAPLGAAEQTIFDSVMADHVVAGLLGVYPNRVLRKALFGVAQDGFERPALITDIPAGLWEVVRDVVLPSHENAHHYLMAPAQPAPIQPLVAGFALLNLTATARWA